VEFKVMKRLAPSSLTQLDAISTWHMYSASLPLIEWFHNNGYKMTNYPNSFAIKFGNLANSVKYDPADLGSCTK